MQTKEKTIAVDEGKFTWLGSTCIYTKYSYPKKNVAMEL